LYSEKWHDNRPIHAGNRSDNVLSGLSFDRIGGLGIVIYMIKQTKERAVIEGSPIIITCLSALKNGRTRFPDHHGRQVSQLNLIIFYRENR